MSAINFKPEMFGIRKRFTPPLIMGENDPFVRFPAHIEELNGEAKKNSELDRALRLPYGVAEGIFFGTIDTAVKLKGNLAFLIHAPAGLGKSRAGLGIFEYYLRPLWKLQGYMWEKPAFAFNYGQASDAIGSDDKRGICIFQDERTHMSGQDSLAKVHALLNQLMVTAREMQKIYICCGVKELKELPWHLRFEVIGMGIGLGFNEALMSAPSGMPIGRIRLPISSEEFYDEYLPLKLENEKRLAAQRGFDDANIDPEQIKIDIQKLWSYAEEQGYDPKSERRWIALCAEAGIHGTIGYQQRVVMRLMMDVDAGKIGNDLIGEGDKKFNSGNEVPIYERSLDSGFQFDYFEELKDLFEDRLVGLTAQIYYDQKINTLNFDDLVKKYKVSLGTIHKHVGFNKQGQPKDKLLKLFGKVSLNLAAKHEDYVQQKYEAWGFNRFFVQGEPKNVAPAPAGFPDRTMEKDGVVVLISCKSTTVDRDIPVYNEQHAGHTGMEPEMAWYHKLKHETKYVALEFVNTSQNHHEETTILFEHPDAIPRKMGSHLRLQLADENLPTLEELIGEMKYAEKRKNQS